MSKQLIPLKYQLESKEPIFPFGTSLRYYNFYPREWIGEGACIYRAKTNLTIDWILDVTWLMRQQHDPKLKGITR